MKIKYLGTAAAEGIPALFCQCETCRSARKKKGKEIRTRSQALIDGELLIDFCPDTYLHLLEYDLDIAALKHCLITHVHADHLIPEELVYRNQGFAVLDDETEPLHLYGSSDVEWLLSKNRDIFESTRLKLHKLEAFVPMKIGRYEIIPLPAVHATENPFVYCIEKDGKRILYAHDTDFFEDSVWEYLEKNKIFFHLVSMDCTEGFRKIDYVGHMNFERNLRLKKFMLEKGFANEKTLFVANHFSHNGHASYEKATEYGKELGILVSYDGMELEI